MEYEGIDIHNDIKIKNLYENMCFYRKNTVFFIAILSSGLEYCCCLVLSRGTYSQPELKVYWLRLPSRI